MNSTTPNASTTLKYGTALSAIALVGTPASAAIISLTLNPGVVPFSATTSGIPTYVAFSDTGGPVFTMAQFNSSFGQSFGTPFGAAAVASLSRFIPYPLAFGTPITAGAFVTNFYVSVPPSVNGTYTLGFFTPSNQAGWIRINFGGIGGAVTYLAAAINDVPGEGILAGQLVPIAPIPESSTVIALAGLATLAVGVGARKLRRRKAAKTTA